MIVAVKTPAEHPSQQGWARVGTNQGGDWVYVEVVDKPGEAFYAAVQHYTPEGAREIAAALLVAADAAEEARKVDDMPFSTVVLDRTGIAWQKRTVRWNSSLPSSGLGTFFTLDELDAARGPLTLLEVAA